MENGNKNIKFKIRKRQLRFLRHNMRKDDLENSTLTGRIKGKKVREKQPIPYLTSFCKSLVELGLEVIEKRESLLRVTKDRML